MRLFLRILYIAPIVVLLLGIYFWHLVLRPNTFSENKVLVIAAGLEWNAVLQEMKEEQIVKRPASFQQLVSLLGYQERIKPGKYLIQPEMSNRDILRMLVSGSQMEVKLVIRSSWSKSSLSGFLARELDIDSTSMLALLSNNEWLNQHGWSSETVKAAIIPNTYRVYWTIGEEGFLKRMFTEYNRFWNENRKRRCEEIGLKPLEVSTLASIVEKETYMVDEMPTIAGVYLNRLRKGMPLEADPTVIFANGDPNVKRVRGEMLNNPSPYNTYRHSGLPPGPICIPSIQAIEAVLKDEKHRFIYFCAKEDFSGYHRFTASYDEHLQNARKYRRALNSKGIR